MARVPDMRAHVLHNMSKNRAIVPEGNRFRVRDLNPSNGIQNFGTYPTRGQALKKLRAIEYFKHHGK